MEKLTFEQLPSAMSILLAEVAEINKKLAEVQLQKIDRKKPIDIDEAAAYVNKSKKTFYNLVSQKKVPFHKQGGLYFFKDELDQWVRSGNVQTVQDLKNEAIRSLAERME